MLERLKKEWYLKKKINGDVDFMRENGLSKEDLDFFIQHMNDDIIPIPDMTVNKFLEITRIMYEECDTYEELTNEELYAQRKQMGADECAWSDCAYQWYCKEKNTEPKEKMEDVGFFEWLIHMKLGYHFEELAFGYWIQKLDVSKDGILWKWEAAVDFDDRVIKTVLAFNALVRRGYSILMLDANDVLEKAWYIVAKVN